MSMTLTMSDGTTKCLYFQNREINAPSFVPVVPIDVEHFLTDNLPISADVPFEFEEEKTDSELTVLLHGLSNKPYHEGMPHARCEQC